MLCGIVATRPKATIGSYIRCHVRLSRARRVVSCRPLTVSVSSIFKFEFLIYGKKIIAGEYDNSTSFVDEFDGEEFSGSDNAGEMFDDRSPPILEAMSAPLPDYSMRPSPPVHSRSAPDASRARPALPQRAPSMSSTSTSFVAQQPDNFHHWRSIERGGGGATAGLLTVTLPPLPVVPTHFELIRQPKPKQRKS